MTYTAITARGFRDRKGTLSEKLGVEFKKIEDRDVVIDSWLNSIDMTIEAQTKEMFVKMDDPVAINTSGSTEIDPAFTPHTDVKIANVYVVLTEDYVKDTVDAVVELQMADDTVIGSVTLDDGGLPAGTVVAMDMVAAEQEQDAGEQMKVVITETDSSSGEGELFVVIEYQH